MIPASYRANFQKIKKQLKAKKVEMAMEKTLKQLKLNPGAITPFGGVAFLVGWVALAVAAFRLKI